MEGETNLAALLATMSPVVMDGEFVFLSFPDAVYGDHANLSPIASVAEVEGLTLVVAKTLADQYSLKYHSSYKGITLEVHSSLDAVGLTAAFSEKLSEHGISVNVIAGYFHDHIFVPADDVNQAMIVLRQLSA